MSGTSVINKVAMHPSMSALNFELLITNTLTNHRDLVFSKCKVIAVLIWGRGRDSQVQLHPQNKDMNNANNFLVL